MAEAVVKSTALLTGKLLVEQINHFDGVRDRVEELKTELETLAAFLIEAVKTRRQDQLVRTIPSEATNVAYDCEDVIEAYLFKVARHGYEDYEGLRMGSVVRWGYLFLNSVPLFKLHCKIGSLNERILSLKTRMMSYGVADRISAAENSSDGLLRRVHSHTREESVVVGFESQLDELVGRLLDPTGEAVIAICGMGGIGKSTMARELYYHGGLREGGYFNAFGWAVASQRLQPNEVLRSVMYSLVPENDHERRRRIDDDIRVDRAHGALYGLMKELKCLVVIDDIWSRRDWERLQDAFPRKNANGSRIVLTTRNENTVLGLDPCSVHLHQVKALDDMKSWELFRMTAFPGATFPDSTKEELGRKMLLHCKGVPLAIVVLAKVLTRKERKEEWQQICDNISAQIRRGSISSMYKEVFDVLKVSYDELPLHLKHCFLHLAYLPEGYTVGTSRLCQLWVAEGIVFKDEHNEVEEDIAEIYLNELVSRSMVQVTNCIEGTGIIRVCGLHDLMRDICVEIAKKDGFLQTTNCYRSMLDNDKNVSHLLMDLLPQRDKQLRRLAVYVTNQELNSLIPTPPIPTSANISRAPNLRSLTLFSDQGVEAEDCKRLMEAIVEDYPLLRVFHCMDYQIKGRFPKKVSNLIHLRYLSLNNTRITELPSSIAKLQLLQTLDLRVHTDTVISIPNVLWKMKQLRHVYFPFDGGLRIGEEESTASGRKRYSIKGGGVLRLDGLVNLQTLWDIDLDGVRLEGRHQSNFERLKTLQANCETNRMALQRLLPLGHHSSTKRRFLLKLNAGIIDEDPMILSGCEALRALNIHAKQNAEFKLRQPIGLEMLPTSLVHIGIWYLQLDDDPLPVLEKLPNLAFLNLIKCYGGRKMVCSSCGFPELKSLFYGLPSFRNLEVEEGALLKLKRLFVYDCPLIEIPDSLPSSVNLQTRWTRYNFRAFPPFYE